MRIQSGIATIARACMPGTAAVILACVACGPLQADPPPRDVPIAAAVAPASKGTAMPKPSRPKGARPDDLVTFESAPFPLEGNLLVPGTDTPFFETDESGRRFHLAPRAGRLFEDATYDDRRSLIVLPPAGRAPKALVLFFHGNIATLKRDVIGRQKVVAQFEQSGLDAVLVAPQLATNALDSSPGRLYEPGFLDAYLDEAARHITGRSGGRITAAQANALPLILVGYSGGYLATAFSLPMQSGTRRRIAGVILLDALFGEEDKFARWIESKPAAFFVSAYSPSSSPLNADLGAALKAASIGVEPRLPPSLVAGEVVLLSVPTASHNDFVTAAWTRDPLRDILSRVQKGLAAAIPR